MTLISMNQFVDCYNVMKTELLIRMLFPVIRSTDIYKKHQS